MSNFEYSNYIQTQLLSFNFYDFIKMTKKAGLYNHTQNE